MIYIDKDASKPIYLQIVDQVKGLIVAGKLKKGDALPSVRQLAGDLGVNMNTAALAFRDLQGQGLVEVRHGARTIISADQLGSESRAEARNQLRSALTNLVLSGLDKSSVIRIVDEEISSIEGGGRET